MPLLAFVAGGIVLVLLLLGGGIHFAGLRMPRDHTVTSRRYLRATAIQVWDLIAAPENAKLWRSDVADVEQLSPAIWKEIDRRGKSMTYETIRSDLPRVLVRRIADPNLPFGGEWTFTITGDQSGTDLQIVEHGFVNPPIFRFLAKYAFGHGKTIERFLDDLERHLRVQN
jgi:hypothetical protein